jgi:ribonuclease E
VLESTTQVCSHCGGTGHVRSQSSVALHVLRGIEEYLLKNTTHDITVRTTPEIALYLLNHKRQSIVDYETRFGVAIVVDADSAVGSQHFAIDRGEPVESPVKIETLFNFAAIPDDDDEDIVIETEEEEDEELEEKPAAAERAPQPRAEGDGEGSRKRKRRRRRRGRNGTGEQIAAQDTVSGETGNEDEGDEEGSEGDDTAAATSETGAESEESQRRKRRRRGKRGGRRNREEGEELSAGAEAVDENAADAGDGTAAETQAEIVEAVAEEAADGQPAMAAIESGAFVTEAKPVKGRSRRKAAASPVEEPVAEAVPAEAETAEAYADLANPAEDEAKPVRANRESNISSSATPTVKSTRSEPAEADNDGKPKKAGWWQRRGFF